MWIEILQTGTRSDSKGRTQDSTTADLDTMVQLYNEKTASDESYQASLVKGHPDDNSPAYGWVERLTRRCNVLYAKLKSFSKGIIDEFRDSKFRRVSISIYPNLLRHIGLLGGATPAVKWLRPVQFEEFDETRYFEYQVNFAIQNVDKFINSFQHNRYSVPISLPIPAIIYFISRKLPISNLCMNIRTIKALFHQALPDAAFTHFFF